jgi:hypothetical protein
VCCRRGGVGGFSYACGAPTACTGVGSLAIVCDDASDCPTGQVCCGAIVGGPGGIGVVNKIGCLAPGSCPASSNTVLCDPPGATGNPICYTGTTCKMSMTTMPGYNICIAP